MEINTITRVTRRVNCMSCNWRRHDHPRSIVTDHYLLDHVLDLRVEQEFFLGLVLLIVTDHYLLGPMLIISPKILEEGTLDPANNSISKCTPASTSCLWHFPVR